LSAGTSRVYQDAADNGFSTFALQPTFANGTTIPNGSFKVLLRVLKMTGDPTNEVVKRYLYPCCILIALMQATPYPAVVG